ncbi:hypothetical protein B0H11DRAFT_2012844 [Mycena galericulata]|nr:hypothetical protein B0H11DRAFT_2012844 [Mycena galericulata]
MTRRSILLVPTSLSLNIWDMASKTRLRRPLLHSFNPVRLEARFLGPPIGLCAGDGSLLCSGCPLLSVSKCISGSDLISIHSSGAGRRSKATIGADPRHAPHPRVSDVRTPLITSPAHSSCAGAKSDGVSRRWIRTSAPCARMFWIRPWRGASGLGSGASVSFRKHGASTLLRVRVRGDMVAVLGRAYPEGDISAACADGAKPVAGRARRSEPTVDLAVIFD